MRTVKSTLVKPNVSKEEPRGIVISPGTARPPQIPFWAYLWSNDDETAERHWHELVPVEKGV
jgi:hypothetical protein